MSACQATIAVVAFALLSATAGAGDLELLPGVTARLEGSRYVPPENAFVWDTWIGAGVDLFRVGETTGYFAADVETILGRERRSFDANQLNYHLEAGLRIRAGRLHVVPFLHHVSRHLVDRPKTQVVDWNVLGALITGRLASILPGRGRYAVSVGYTVEGHGVGYEWQVEGVVDLELIRPWGTPYLEADLRFVSVDDRSSIARGAFVDLLGECGVRFARDGRSLDLFVAYEHRNDVLPFEPGVRDRALFGLRITFASVGSATPELPPGRPRRP